MNAPSDDEVERVARAIWQAESERAGGRKRLSNWGDEAEATREKYRVVARAAIAATDIAQLRAENERLREALEPFAREADGWDADVNDGMAFDEQEPIEIENQLKVGDLRRARAALTPTKDNGNG